MPQIKVRGINENDICKISEKMVDELVEAVKCPRDYFEIECIKSVAMIGNSNRKNHILGLRMWFFNFLLITLASL